jgi:probable rRNA maturation factor
MSGDLRLLNHQRARSVNVPLLREMTGHLLQRTEFDLTIHLVGSKEMADLNQLHLGHDGSTDVITLDYGDGPETPLAGEIFICVEDALLQAKQFRTSWQSEFARYVIHGILHLQGYDDLETAARRRMKRVENSRLKKLARKFPLKRLDAKAR